MGVYVHDSTGEPYGTETRTYWIPPRREPWWKRLLTRVIPPEVCAQDADCIAGPGHKGPHRYPSWDTRVNPPGDGA